MKKVILFVGILFCMLMTMPSYAQTTTKEKQKSNMEVVPPKKMEQIKVIQPPKVIIVPKQERVIHGRIDPITGEEIPPYTTGPPSKEITVIFPPSQLQYPNSNWFVLDNTTITLEGEATVGRTLEIKMLRAYNEDYTLVQDWTSFIVKEDGIWIARIPWSGVTEGQSVKLKILIRDRANRSEVKTVFVGRE